MKPFTTDTMNAILVCVVVYAFTAWSVLAFFGVLPMVGVLWPFAVLFGGMGMVFAAVYALAAVGAAVSFLRRYGRDPSYSFRESWEEAMCNSLASVFFLLFVGVPAVILFSPAALAVIALLVLLVWNIATPARRFYPPKHQ